MLVTWFVQAVIASYNVDVCRLGPGIRNAWSRYRAGGIGVLQAVHAGSSYHLDVNTRT